jgi:hypothetical protein
MKVDIIQIKGSSVLVQYIGKDNLLHRCIVPERNMIILPSKEGIVDEDELEMAIPYGIPWTDFLADLEILITGDMIANSLISSGIWTKEDYTGKPREVSGAIQAVVLPSILSVLNDIVSKFEHKEEYSHE